MSIVIMIPSRYASTRFSGKPLSVFRGADGISRTLIEHTWRVGIAVKEADAFEITTEESEDVCNEATTEVADLQRVLTIMQSMLVGADQNWKKLEY